MGQRKKKNSTEIVNLVSDIEETQITVYHKECEYIKTNFNKTESDLRNTADYKNFIKACEKMVYSHEGYHAFKDFLINDCDLNTCSLYSNISGEDCTLELHHGPIFTLYDYCEITLMYLLKENLPVSTFNVSDIIIREHIDNNVQCVILSKMAHAARHAKGNKINVDIPLTTAWGNIIRYLEKYKDCLSYIHFNKIMYYLENSSENTNIFNENITYWGKNYGFEK